MMWMRQSPSTPSVSASASSSGPPPASQSSREATSASCSTRPSAPGGAAQPMPDGRKPEPGGWNRVRLEVDDLASTVETLRNAGAHFRNAIVTGYGGKQILLDDPAGNPIELFELPRQ